MAHSIIFLGSGGGNDAPGWGIGPDGKPYPIPGWEIDARTDLVLALEIMQSVARLKTPELGVSINRELMKFVQKEISSYTKGGGVIVIGGGQQQFGG